MLICRRTSCTIGTLFFKRKYGNRVPARSSPSPNKTDNFPSFFFFPEECYIYAYGFTIYSSRLQAYHNLIHLKEASPYSMQKKPILYIYMHASIYYFNFNVNTVHVQHRAGRHDEEKD